MSSKQRTGHISIVTFVLCLSVFLSACLFQGQASAEDSDVEGFVTRFYEQCLGRQPDAAGLSHWVDSLNSGQITEADLAWSFIFSEEFQNSSTTDEEYLEVLYRAFFDREPDDGGFNHWLNLMAQGMDRASVLNGFTSAQEFLALCDSYGISSGDDDTNVEGFVTRFYQQCLDRDPDTDGLNHWVESLKTGAISGSDLAWSFIFSEEFQNSSTTDEEYLEVLYRAFFDREPDDGGFNHWLDLMDRGMGRESVLNGFTSAQEFITLCESYGIESGIEDSSSINWLCYWQNSTTSLIASHEDNTAQLYNNAIASMVFMIHGDYHRAEAIFNYFNGRMDDTEFTVNGVASGFYQKRDSTTGLPDTSTDRWFGDNAFLLMALNYYKKTTGNTIYDSMAKDIAVWLISLQNTDGSIGNGHTETEGYLDVYAALKEHGNTTEAEKIKTWLESAPNQDWKNGPLDIHSWRVLSLGSDYGFCLNKTQNHKRTIVSNGNDITGFVGAINRSDNIWGEGTGQMILAFYIAGYKSYGDYYLQELKKTIIKSSEPSNVNTLPFLVLSDPIDNWSDPTKGHVASVAWYLFALKHFNPFSGETVTTYDKPNPILRIQAENYDSVSGDVRLDSTGSPLEGSAIHLAGDDNISCPSTTCSNTADYTFFTLDSIPAAKISVRYADDVGGEICHLYIDSQLKYTFTSIDTGTWEDYIDPTPFDIGSIAAGNHTLQIVCEDKGTWGVTVDAVNISQ